ncbi:MAG: cadherin-like beta sandwich domain-containing protein [Chloroflexi bacterium]|nr:cadherin-like beta sandwich domain-containing protein [Chloroflexota bacterium]
MNRIINQLMKHGLVRSLFLAACIISLAFQPLTVGLAMTPAAPTLPVLWTVGGLSAGTDGAGNAERMTVDASGNVAVLSASPAGGNLAVSSYTVAGAFRWRSAISPTAGIFVGDWVAAAPNGDIVALGHQYQASTDSMNSATIVRYASDGTFQWKVVEAGSVLSLGRLVVDGGGNAYFSINSVLYKYSPTGTLLWSTETGIKDFGAALSPDGADVVLTGVVGSPVGLQWATTAFDTATGAVKWLTTGAEGIAARDVVVDATRVYVAGQGVTGVGTPAISYFLTVVAYDRTTGARLWRTDKKPADGSSTAGLWMAQAPDGSLVVAGQTNRGFLDWYTVAFENTGTVRWEAVRDGGLSGDEIPASVLVMANGSTVVTGRGGPYSPGGFIQGVTVGYSKNGTLLWEAFSSLETVWAAAISAVDVCATGGYDALITCWRTPTSGADATLSALEMSAGTLTPSFTTNEFTYTASVDNSVNSLTVTPTLTDSNASVKVNGAAVISGSASTPITLNVGGNLISVLVTAENGVNTQTYSITVTRAVAPTYTITGNAGGPGVTINYTGGSVISNAISGEYIFTVDSGWTGTITPVKTGHVFTPAAITISNPLAINLMGQDFIIAAQPSFQDVPADFWAWLPIEILFSNGITTGCGAAPMIYCPDAPVSRAQMAVFLVRGIHGSAFTPSAATGMFQDVPPGYWADAWIEQLAADGVTAGCSTNPNRFCPENIVTRAQMAVFLVSAKHGSSFVPPAATGMFNDVPTGYWAADWIEQLLSDGVTTGCGVGTFCPEQSVTRAQMAVFISRAFNFK